MTKSKKYLLIRAVWYLVGFALFYAPLALLQRLLIYCGASGKADIHGSCFRMALQGPIAGKGFDLISTSGIIIALIAISALLLGPIFCGRFCVVGAVSEYISRLVPERFKVNWQKHISPAPVRYGVLAAFLATPFLGLSVVCAYCNYSLMQRFILGDIGVLGSTTILTGFIWLVILGAFAKGGRGFCSYLCPIGAFQNFLYWIGSSFGFTGKLKFNPEKCTSCNMCVKECPMGSIQKNEDRLKYNVHTCITCQQCTNVCPKGAIEYGKGKVWTNEEKKGENS